MFSRGEVSITETGSSIAYELRDKHAMGIGMLLLSNGKLTLEKIKSSAVIANIICHGSD